MPCIKILPFITSGEDKLAKMIEAEIIIGMTRGLSVAEIAAYLATKLTEKG